MRVYMTSEECWELKRHWRNAVENGWYALCHSLEGWQARSFYWDWSGMVTIEWEPTPFPSAVCGGCRGRVAQADIEPITLYQEKDGRLCRSRPSLCGYCRSEIVEMDGWPRDDRGRWMTVEDCEAVAA